MTRRYAIFDSGSIGTDLAIERGGDILTTIAPSLDINRACRVSVAIDEFDAFVEFILFGFSGTAIANKVSIGVTTATASLSTYVGGDEFGIGYRPGEGQIHYDGSSEASVSVGALGDVLGVRLVPDGEGSGSVVWYRKPFPSGTPEVIGELQLPGEMADGPWYFTASLGSTADAGDLRLALNSGKDDYEHPAAGLDAGTYETPALPGAIRVAEQHYISGADDTPPRTRWETGITAADIERERGVHFWIWGGTRDSSAPGSRITVEIQDSARRFDAALGGEYRDQPATLHTVDAGTALSTATSLGSYVVDSVEAVDRITRRINLRGPLAEFQVPMLRRRIRPDATPESAGLYWPMLIGPAFSAPPRLLDKSERIYAIDAVGAEGVGIVRDRGNPLDPSAPDYTIGDGGQTVTLANETPGQITVDAGATGGSYVPESPIDAIDGIGNPFSGSPSTPPTRWAVSDVDDAYYNGGLAFENVYGVAVWARALDAMSDPIALEAGKSYRYEIVIASLTQYPEFTALTRSVQLQTSTSPLSEVLFWQAPGTYTGIYSPATSHQVYLGHRGNAAGGTPAVVTKFQLIEIPVLSVEDEEEADDEVAALAMPLADMVRVGIEVRCRKSRSLWDITSAEAIDELSGYAGQGFWAAEQIMLRQYLDLLLDAYTASGFEAADGRLSFARLIDPETVEHDIELSAGDIQNDPVPVWDQMPGLSRRIGCRRNEHVFRESDLATDLDAVGWRARRKLTERYRYVMAYNGPLAPGLAHADTAEPLDTRLVLPADAQAEINRIGAIASIARSFFSLDVADSEQFELGRVALVPIPQWFPEGSRQCLIVRVKDKRLAQTGNVVVWTRAPWAPAGS
jgi:hypothetical protein